MPVQEFNLTACPLVQSSWKPPSRPRVEWIQAGKSPQPVRRAGDVAY